MANIETIECVNNVDNTTAQEPTDASEDSDDGFTMVKKKVNKSQNRRRNRQRNEGRTDKEENTEDFEFPPEPPLNHPVHVVYSRLSLDSIEDFVDEKTGVKNSISFIRVVYDRDGKATNRAIAVIQPEIYSKLNSWMRENSREVFDHSGRRQTRFNNVDFSISKYKIRDSDRQRKGSPTNTLFVPVPRALRTKQTFVNSYVNKCMQMFVDNNMIPGNSWNINIPLTTRESGGEIRNGCYISFRGVHPDSLALVRVVLDDTFWEYDCEDELILRCHWLKTRAKSDDKRKNSKKPKLPQGGSQPKPVGRKDSTSSSSASEESDE